jgi:hypothetical protein
LAVNGDVMGTAAGPPPGWMDDPTGTFAQRYWDGAGYTEWVLADNGTAVRDTASGAAPTISKHPRPPAPQHAGLSTHTRPGVSPQATTHPQGHAGDAVLSLVSKITLQSWINDRMSKALWLPDLAEFVRRRPTDPRALTWLGLRLQDFERIRSRASRSTAPVTVTGAILSPIVKPAIRAATSALSSSDGTPASKKVLGRAWQLLEPRVTARPQDPAAVCLMARNYLSARQPKKAWEVAAAATRLQPSRGEAYYILAEAAFDCGDTAGAQKWAAQALDRGCSLARALSRPDTPFRRQALHSEKASMAMPTVEDHWRAFAAYYDGANGNEVSFFFGPQPVTGGAT